jgi:uncharacterized membrane protein AbrB (regulator of aidB expression)
MILKGKVYDILKWFTLVVLPALGAAYFGLAGIWALPMAGEIAATVVVAEVLLGSLLGISSARFFAAQAAGGET